MDPELGSAEVDPAKLADILTNLFVNAIKFTPDGGTIRIAARPLVPVPPHAVDHTEDDDLTGAVATHDTDSFIEFQVADEGVGIQIADRPHLFEPFFTGFDTMHHSSGEFQFCKRGIGLGLCLVKTFVELHGGTVSFESAPGQGTTFAFRIPRRSPRQIPVDPTRGSMSRRSLVTRDDR